MPFFNNLTIKNLKEMGNVISSNKGKSKKDWAKIRTTNGDRMQTSTGLRYYA
jgi:hypothetical protein